MLFNMLLPTNKPIKLTKIVKESPFLQGWEYVKNSLTSLKTGI